MQSYRKVMLAGALSLAAISNGQCATTVTNSFAVQMTITSQCTVSNPTTLNFGSSGLIAAAINQTNTFNVTCTNTTPYTVGLDPGLNASSGQRRMKGGTTNNEYISYNLYSDTARTIAWGNVTGSWVSGSGTGAATSYTVYGQVPAQNTPSPSTNYADTVTISVTY